MKAVCRYALAAGITAGLATAAVAQNDQGKKGLLLGKPDPSLLLGRPDPTKDASTVKKAPEVVNDPAPNVAPPEACPAPAQGGEAAADWRPPPIPPKDAKDAARPAPQGGKAASDWRPPPIPPLVDQNGPACPPQATESADWRPPPIPPK